MGCLVEVDREDVESIREAHGKVARERDGD